MVRKTIVVITRRANQELGKGSPHELRVLHLIAPGAYPSIDVNMKMHVAKICREPFRTTNIKPAAMA